MPSFILIRFSSNPNQTYRRLSTAILLMGGYKGRHDACWSYLLSRLQACTKARNDDNKTAAATPIRSELLYLGFVIPVDACCFGVVAVVNVVCD